MSIIIQINPPSNEIVWQINLQLYKKYKNIIFKMSQNQEHKKLHETDSIIISGTQMINQHQNQDYKQNQVNADVPHNIFQQLLIMYSKNTTKSQHSGKGDNQKKQGDNQMQQQKYVMPQPLDSQEQQSREVQYLAHFETYQSGDQISTIGSLDAQQTKRQKLRGSVRGQLLSILYKCIVYARKQERLTKTDDDLLYESIKNYFHQEIYPKPKNIIGQVLLANGYFLIAYAILNARLNKSKSILTYLFNQFYQNKQTIQENEQQFLQFYNRDKTTFNLSQDPQKDMRKSTMLQFSKYNKKSQRQIQNQSGGLKRSKLENAMDAQNLQNDKQQFQNQGYSLNKMNQSKTTVFQVSMQNIKKDVQQRRQNKFSKNNRQYDQQ